MRRGRRGCSTRTRRRTGSAGCRLRARTTPPARPVPAATPSVFASSTAAPTRASRPTGAASSAACCTIVNTSPMPNAAMPQVKYATQPGIASNSTDDVAPTPVGDEQCTDRCRRAPLRRAGARLQPRAERPRDRRHGEWEAGGREREPFDPREHEGQERLDAEEGEADEQPGRDRGARPGLVPPRRRAAVVGGRSQTVLRQRGHDEERGDRDQRNDARRTPSANRSARPRIRRSPARRAPGRSTPSTAARASRRGVRRCTRVRRCRAAARATCRNRHLARSARAQRRPSTARPRRRADRSRTA